MEEGPARTHASSHAERPGVSHAERLSVPLRWWVQATMMVASFWLAMIVALPAPLAWAITAGAMAVVGAGLVAYGSARIAVSEVELLAGRARIERHHLGSAVALDREEARRAAGVDADARAYLLLRPYLHRAVKVEITDPRDPAPYWLLGTRHPDRLAAVLGASQQTTPPA